MSIIINAEIKSKKMKDGKTVGLGSHPLFVKPPHPWSRSLTAPIDQKSGLIVFPAYHCWESFCVKSFKKHVIEGKSQIWLNWTDGITKSLVSQGAKSRVNRNNIKQKVRNVIFTHWHVIRCYELIGNSRLLRVSFQHYDEFLHKFKV